MPTAPVPTRHRHRRLRALVPLLPLCAVVLGAQAPDSTRAQSGPRTGAAAARQAQAEFERARRDGLGFSSGGATSEPDVQFGTIYYWNNNNDVPPRPELPEIGAARRRLIQSLREAALQAPTDDWVAGQRAKYAVEGRDVAEANAVIGDCKASAWWCAALTGFVKHAQNDAPGAERAFNSALAQMPEAQRCEWQNIAPWMKKADSLAYLGKSCADRVAYNTKLFWLGKPFAHLDGNDLRNELLARQTFNTIEAGTATVYGPWRVDFAQSQLRYGWPVAWSRQNTIVSRRGDMVSNTIGHEATPSHDFMPGAGALADPYRATPADYPFNARYAQMRYAPRYAPGGFQDLGGQFVRFRRGDSTMLVGTWVMDGKARYERGRARAALVLEKGPDQRVARIVKDGQPLRGALALEGGVLRDTMLASIEVLSDARKFAGRYRTGVAPLERDAMLSDLLLLSVRATDAASAGLAGIATLESVIPSVLGGTDIGDGQSFGIFWEYYGGPGATVTISITPLDSASGFRRLGSLFRLGGGGTAGGASLRIPDPAQPDGGPGRRLTLTMPEVKPGRYRLAVEVTSPGASPARRELVLRVPEGPPAAMR
ncbi:MAG: hypothetical protein IT355_07045 [Gemmatimonadaceae bacterium]|nr:hypothetical protein [Gemmatimonadaceae bacterium]